MPNSITTIHWTTARVGCHWSSGGFAISTYQQGLQHPQPFPMSGYVLRWRREEVGRYPTLQRAQDAAAGMGGEDNGR